MTKHSTLSLLSLFFTLLFSSATYSQSCDNWLYLAPGTNANVGLGDLDMSGNQLTIEATFCRTTPYPPEYHGGDLVSKHAHNYDNNYLLRPNLACMLTSTGFYLVQAPCPVDINVTYHVAMVYDGREFRNYVDGVLENAGEVRLAPQGQGHSSAGVRINLRDYFKGAIAVSRMTRRPLAPEEFLKR